MKFKCTAITISHWEQIQVLKNCRGAYISEVDEVAVNI